tara:strand:- start:4865 stop:7138 length:2274 start_codon:yes stop_codon:yes gene_type:complete
MSSIYPIYTDRVRYRLYHNPTGVIDIKEPKGFRDDENEFIRDKKLDGIFPEITNDLIFFDEASSWINTVYEVYGINADIICTKDERNPKTDVFELVKSGFLDLVSLTRDETSTSLKFVSSGLLRILKARENEKIEIDRLTTFSGLEVPYLEPSKVALNGRGIFLKSLLETKEDQNTTSKFSMRFQTQNSRTASLSVPVTKVYISDTRVNATTESSFTSTPDIGVVESLFYLLNDRNKTININIKCKFNIVEPSNIDISDLSSDAFLKLYLVVFENKENYNVKQRIPLSDNIVSSEGLRLTSVDVSYVNDSFELLEGESLSLQWYGGASSWGDFIGGVGVSFGYMRPRFDNIVSSINIKENSNFFNSVSKVHFPFDIAERFLKIFTDKDNLLVSNVLGRKENGYESDGEASLIGLAHGFWIRQFSKDSESETDEENRYKSMSTTFKEFYESYFTTWNLGAGIEKVGFREVFRIEKKEYFYNKNVLIKLGKEVNGKFEYIQVNKVKRTLDLSSFYSGIEVGYEKGGDYEEAVGLDEYNTKTTLTTVLNKLEKIYNIVSKYRADSYGIEFARRLPFDSFPTEDTKYDSSIWLLDLIRNPISNVFNQRLWADDFDTVPTGVFDPETAQNLRLSPVNTLFRHGWVIGSGLIKYPLDFIRYGSSVANSALTTTINGVSSSENGNIRNNQIEKARTDGEIVSFEFNVDYDLLQKIQGKTLILGKEIPNFYGLVAFKNEKGEIETGYIDKVSPNGEGKWTLRKSN